MLRSILRLVSTCAVWGLLPAMVLAQPNGPNLAGEWKGPLAIPGGSLPIQLTIVQPAATKLTGTLDLPGKKLNRIPVLLTFRNDSVLVNGTAAGVRYACLPTLDGQELRGIWTQPGLRVPLVLRRVVPEAVAATGLPSRSATAAPAVTYHTEAATIGSEPGRVARAGTLSIPDGKGPFPAVMLLPDMGSPYRASAKGSYRFFAELAAALARQGIAVLRLDDRATGQLGGTGSLATTAELVRDAQAALTYLRQRPTLAPARIGLIGHGEGGNVALLAATLPQPPNFVVTLAAAGVSGLEVLANQPEPITSPADTARTGAARRQAWADVLSQAAKLRASGSNAAQVDTYLAQQRLKVKSEDRRQAEAMLKFRRTMLEIVRQTTNDDQAQAIVLNMLHQRYPDQEPAIARARAQGLITPWNRYYLSFNPQLALAGVQCPVLLLHGTDDAEVNAAVNLTALEKGLKGKKNLTVRRLPGVNHWFQTPAAELIAAPDGTVDPIISTLMLDTVRDWILQQATP